MATGRAGTAALIPAGLAYLVVVAVPTIGISQGDRRGAPVALRLRHVGAAVLTWSAAAAALAAGLVSAQRHRGPLDDTDAAHQRDGLVVDLGPVDLAPHLAAGTPAAVLFLRPEMLTDTALSLAGPAAPELPAAVRLLVCQPAPAPRDPPGGLTVVDDSHGAVQRMCRMRGPRDGGYPVGFAVVDGSGRLRYRTLDPGMAGRWFELRTMVRAVVP